MARLCTRSACPAGLVPAAKVANPRTALITRQSQCTHILLASEERWVLREDEIPLPCTPTSMPTLLRPASPAQACAAGRPGAGAGARPRGVPVQCRALAAARRHSFLLRRPGVTARGRDPVRCRWMRAASEGSQGRQAGTSAGCSSCPRCTPDLSSIQAAVRRPKPGGAAVLADLQHSRRPGARAVAARRLPRQRCGSGRAGWSRRQACRACADDRPRRLLPHQTLALCARAAGLPSRAAAARARLRVQRCPQPSGQEQPGAGRPGPRAGAGHRHGCVARMHSEGRHVGGCAAGHMRAERLAARPSRGRPQRQPSSALHMRRGPTALVCRVRPAPPPRAAAARGTGG